ncbi:MAG: hypothetical protein H7343_16030 [Undibacterium sp.]|nr:hypothetical protein [Opitutaceae bacterium]
MSLRRLFYFVCCVVLAVPAVTRAAEAELTRVWPAWRNAESFDRISEYFSNRENTGGHTVLRSQPEARAGYYFLIRAKADHAQPGLKFVLQIITPDKPDPKIYTFPAALIAKETVFDLGLTGADWPDRKTHAVAWHLSVVAADGRELASQQSFLWAKPTP